MNDDSKFALMLGNTVARAKMPVTCSVCNQTYHFDRPGLPHIHERYFCHEPHA